MYKYLASGIAGLIIGIAIGVAGTILAYPFIFPPPEVNEQVVNVQAKSVIATGTFIHPNPSDPVHWGKGGVSVYQGPEGLEIFLQQDFEVGPGPAYHVYISTGRDIRNNDDFESARNIDIGKLKSFKSSQVYRLPVTTDQSNINSVVVWCEAFGQLITSASLTK